MPPKRRKCSNLGRKTRNARKQAQYRSKQSEQQRKERNEIERIRILQSRTTRRPQAAIESMTLVCPHCKTIKHENEALLCCANGKVKIKAEQVDSPSDPLYSHEQ